jgi:RNA polymerase sigma factor (sigma-70 family)
MTEKDYNECVKLYADNVYRFILKNLRNEEDSKDIVQTSFEKMWIHRATVENNTCKSFLFTVAYNAMIDFIRKNKRIVLKEDFTETAQGTTNQGYNTKRILQEALAQLNERDKSLVMLKDYEGYNYAEIGEITGLNESQVKVYLHRARLQLREYIGKIENVL